MATNRALRAALLGQMDWSKQNLSARVQQKKKTAPMSTEDATYLIAHENGIKIDRYLSREQVAHVRTLVHHQPSTAALSPKRAAQTLAKGKAGVREIRFPNEFKVANPLLASGKLKEATEMAAIFPLLYVLENSMRELIKRVMYAKYGKDWWDTQLVSGKLKGVHQKVTDRMKSESQRRWHQRRGSHPIDYVDLGDLGSIVNGKQSDFIPSIIESLEWFAHLMRELEPSRNVVCHMNPLDDGNIGDVKSWYRKWVNTLSSALADGTIPPPPP